MSAPNLSLAKPGKLMADCELIAKTVNENPEKAWAVYADHYGASAFKRDPGHADLSIDLGFCDLQAVAIFQRGEVDITAQEIYAAVLEYAQAALKVANNAGVF
jgi:hypothetical protein